MDVSSAGGDALGEPRDDADGVRALEDVHSVARRGSARSEGSAEDHHSFFVSVALGSELVVAVVVGMEPLIVVLRP